MSKLSVKRLLSTALCTVVAAGAILAAAPSKASAFTSSDADAAMTAFNNKFYNTSSKWFYDNTNRNSDEDWWVEAHMWNLVMDAYERTNSQTYLTQMHDMYDSLVARSGHDWTWNTWNDDIMWWSLAATRAYQLTGRQVYLDDAKANIDWILDTQLDNTMGGGVWEHNDNHYDKNSCINFPTVIASVNLSNILNDSWYYDRAVEIYNWAKANLTDGNGKVYDAKLTNGTTDMGSSHYNQGTFIGAAMALYKKTNNSTYLDDAVKVANWTRANLVNGNGILYFETHKDLQGGKLIFLEYLNKLINDGGRTEFKQWMINNVQTAWNNRNNENLTGGDWTSVPSGTFDAWPAASAVAGLNLLASGTSNYASISLTNPGFEDGNINGWTEWHPSGQTAKYGVDSNDVHSGTKKLYFWDTNPYQQSVHQWKYGLSNGYYYLSAWVKVTAYGGAPYTARMEAMSYGGSNLYKNMIVDGQWRQYTQLVHVTNGQLDIGFYVNSPGSTSMQIDDVTLVKNG